MNPAGVYVQDQMSLNKWTINAGLRFDYLKSSYPDFDVDPRRYVPVAEHFEGADVLNWKDLSPRLAVSYDLFGTGKTALKAAASRYVMQERLTQSTALVVPTRASVSQISRAWTDANRDYVVNGDPLNPAANGELGASPNANFGKQITNFRLDPDWANGFGTRPYNWEFMGARADGAGVEYLAAGRLLPQGLRQLHRDRQSAGVSCGLRSVLHHGADGCAPPGWRRQSDVRPLRPEPEQGRARGYDSDELVELRQAAGALQRRGRDDQRTSAQPAA